MKSLSAHHRLLLAIALCGLLLAGCVTSHTTPMTLYDLGPVRAGADAAQAGLPPIAVAEVQAPTWLESRAMYYRLAYADALQPRPYATSHWTMPPAALFGQKLKLRLAQAGGVVLAASDGAANVPVLRIEADDFTQTFASARDSSAQVALRASLFNGRLLIAQKTFTRRVAAPSADAAGGAAALAGASDALIDDMIAWLAQLSIKK